MMADLRFAIRMLLKSPLLSLTAIVTLALGIGANSSIFSVVYGVLLRPLPLASPERLVQLWETKPLPGFRGSASAPNIRDWREQNTVFSGIAAFRYQSFALQDNGDAERLRAAVVSANYFTTLGAKPILGRTFLQGRRPGK